tara:strand:+ start:1227 stop:1697 length:471 start_codon:yes stop_codon:yes gene_type:complete
MLLLLKNKIYVVNIMVKELSVECELVIQKLKKYNLYPDPITCPEYVKQRKKIKRSITCNNDTIKLLINLVTEMNGSILKQQKRIKELNDKLQSLKSREPPPMPDRAYQILLKENEDLKSKLNFIKRQKGLPTDDDTDEDTDISDSDSDTEIPSIYG